MPKPINSKLLILLQFKISSYFYFDVFSHLDEGGQSSPKPLLKDVYVLMWQTTSVDPLKIIGHQECAWLTE